MDSALQVCMRVQGREADITGVQRNYNKTPRRKYSIMLSSGMCEILYTHEFLCMLLY